MNAWILTSTMMAFFDAGRVAGARPVVVIWRYLLMYGIVNLSLRRSRSNAFSLLSASGRPCTLPSSSSSLVASTCRELAGVSFCRYPIMLKSLALLSLCASSALGFVASGAERTARQSTSAGFVSLSGVSRSTSQLEAHKLVLIRHGESEWNDLNIFTGWADAALNEKGLREAAQGGQLLKDAGRRG